MPRPKGAGALYAIDPQKHDSFAMRQMLHAGGEPVKDHAANLLIHWCNLIAQRDDCAQRLENGEGDKWTRKRCKQLNAEIPETWRKLGEDLIKSSGAANSNSADLSEKLELLSKVARPPVFAWQKEVVRIVDLLQLQERSSELSPINDPLKGLTKEERQAVQRAAREAGRKEAEREEPARKLASEKRAKYLKTPKRRAEQRKKQADAVAEFEERQRIKPAESDTQHSLAVSARQLLEMVRERGFKVHVNDDTAKRMLRRFVRDTLQITLRREQGHRSDLRRTKRRGS